MTLPGPPNRGPFLLGLQLSAGLAKSCVQQQPDQVQEPERNRPLDDWMSDRLAPPTIEREGRRVA